MRRTLAVFCSLWIAGPASAQVAGPMVPVPGQMIQSVTLGGKLRIAYAGALAGNYTVNPPWFACVSGNNSLSSVVCSAWAASASYPQGAVVSNSGHLYVNLNSTCTSASSGGPTTATNSAISDNTCSWMYSGEPRTTANDAQAPAVSTSTGFTAFTGSVNWAAGVYPQVYTPLGANFSVYATNYQSLNTFDFAPGSLSGYGALVCAMVTDAKFAVGVASGSAPYNILIDDRVLSPQTVLFNAGAPANVVVDFTATSGFKARKVCILGGKNNPIYEGLFTTAAGGVAPIAPPALNAVALWDSYDGGSNYGPFTGYSVFSQQLAAQMGWSMSSMGTGGTGPQNPNGSNYNYNGRASDATNAAAIAAANVVMFNASTNDGSCTGTVSASCPVGSETTAIQNLLTTIRTTSPKALIVVVGPSPINQGVSFSQLVTEDATAAAAVSSWLDSAGAGMKCYIPWASVQPPPLFSASYQTGVPSGLGSTAALINTGDNTHPTDLGTGIMAKWVASQIVKTCLPALN